MVLEHGRRSDITICALKAVILNYNLNLVSTSLRLRSFFSKCSSGVKEIVRILAMVASTEQSHEIG